MSEIQRRNAEYADTFKTLLGLRYEPVAVRLIRENEEIPEKYPKLTKQHSYCQTVAAARHGESMVFTEDMSGCNVGASAIGMVLTPEKVASGEFHYNIGAHNDQEATKAMIDARTVVPFKTKGAIVTPLKDADFEPDVMIIEDIPERVYWFVPLSTADGGGRAYFSTAPFQAACVDVTTTPMKTGAPNISLGCYGCRKRTDIQKDEMLMGIPWKLVPHMVDTLNNKYKDGILKTARRD